jgi:hypothetical protein
MRGTRGLVLGAMLTLLACPSEAPSPAPPDDVGPDADVVVAPEACQSDEDCQGTIDDLGACEEPTCVQGACVATPIAGCGSPTEPTCLVSGEAGAVARCTLEVVAAEAAGPHAASLQLVIAWDTARASFLGLFCGETPDDFFDPCTVQSQLPTHHSILTVVRDDGAQAMMLIHQSAPKTPLTGAMADEEGARVLEALFTLTETIEEASPLSIRLEDVVVGSTAAQPLSVTVEGWTVTTGSPALRDAP